MTNKSSSEQNTATETTLLVPTIEYSETPAKMAGNHINDILSVKSGKPILLLLAGGSSLEVTRYINPDLLSEHVTVTVTDERFTDDISENNFENLQTTSFYNDLIQADCFCINTAIFGGDDTGQHSSRFSKNIEEWIKDFPKGIIIALYGIGLDGHTAGIIPGIYKGKEFTEKFNGQNFVEAVIDESGGSAFPERVTTTFTFMKKVDFPIFYVAGEQKREVLKRALEVGTDLENIPAAIIQQMKSPIIFTDIKL